jgi:hypothetical protein
MSNETNITCPKCGAEIPLNEAVSHRIREELTAEFNEQRQEHNAALTAREQRLAASEAIVEQRRQEADREVLQRLDQEKAKLTADAERKAAEKLALEMQDLRAQVTEQRQQLAGAQALELDLRKKQRDLDSARETLDLELARKLDEERAKIVETACQSAAETERLKLAEKDQLIHGLKRQIEALSLRAEQGSIQVQGETLEVELEKDLRLAFPYDEIQEVKKGVRGGDVLQRVSTNAGLPCGSILWEAKRARNWSGDWPAKLKEDQREAKCELAVLVVTCPPPGLRGLGLADGVWVCEPALAPIIAAALRQGLVSTAMQRLQETGRADKMSRLYDYLCGLEFRQHVEAVVESFTALREQLGAEQRAFARQWKEREQQITRAIQHTAMLYGSIQGVTGRDVLPAIESLQLPGEAS